MWGVVMSYGIKLGNRVISGSKKHQYVLIPKRLEDIFNDPEIFDLSQKGQFSSPVGSVLIGKNSYVKPVKADDIPYGAMLPNKLYSTLNAHTHNETIKIPYNHLQPGQSIKLTHPVKYKADGIFNVDYTKLRSRYPGTKEWNMYPVLYLMGGPFLSISTKGNSINVSLKHNSGFYNSQLTYEVEGELLLTYISYENKKEDYGFLDKGNYITENTFLSYADDLGTVTLKNNSKFTTKMPINYPNGWTHAIANNCRQVVGPTGVSKTHVDVNPGIATVRFFKVTEY